MTIQVFRIQLNIIVSKSFKTLSAELPKVQMF
jgi:hypothetical protein